ncbi:hypothetical protein GCM10023200_17350 [Actinomycetospora chlora]|uniref:MarR family transcriptional regulator n=1 Tax=Actinomycetospora chlora TaxID=663608 RepID=A0ABP9AP48_9PSEU
MLSASPDGLSDAALARELGGDVRTQTVNQLCRRMAAEGELERVGTRPILNRLPAPPPPKARKPRKPRVATPEPPEPPVTTPKRVRAARPDQDPTGNGTAPATPKRGPRRKVAAEPSVAEPVVAEPVVAPVAVEDPPVPEASSAEDPAPAAEPTANGTAPEAPEPHDGAASLGPPAYDALQAWSRVVNVQALVAGWLVRRGATLRWLSLEDGPARDLVASLDGDDVHVEVTGWPTDGARTHPTTIAGDWFSAAEQAAAERRRAHPRARIVIALPDTRRYRTLTEQRAASLAGARAEVWFVDPAGAVHAR